MDKERDEYFSPADAEEWIEWDEGLRLQDLNAYLNELWNYYGNREHDTATD